MTDSRSRPSIAWGTLIVGLVLGLVLGAAGGVLAPRLKAPEPPPSPWIDAGLAWKRLPEQADAGPLPQAFAVPALAWDYAAISRPLGPLPQARPSILRVELQVSAGKTGVSLAAPDGQTLVSAEKVVAAGGPRSLYFAIGPDQPPVAILLRNYDSQGVSGTATVSKVSYAREDTLPPEELTAINAAD